MRSGRSLPFSVSRLWNRRRDSLDDTAATWVVRRQNGLSPAEAEEFRLWLSADSRHIEAFARHEKTWTALNRFRIAGKASDLNFELERRQRRRTRRNRALLLTGVGLAAGLFLVFIPAPTPETAPMTDVPSTVVIWPLRQVLADGSVVELDAGAEIAVSYSPSQRNVRLLKGSALFQVAKNPARPFIVTAGNLQVTAVGTAFCVSNAPPEVELVVTEGRVSVSRVRGPVTPADSSPAPSFYVSEKEEFKMSGNNPVGILERPRKINAEQLKSILAWRGRKLEFNGTTIDDVVVLFNHENTGFIMVADPSIAHRRITGILQSDDPKGFIRLLEQGMNVQAKQSGDLVVLSAADR